MAFTGISYLAVVLAAIAGQLAGVAWYGLFAKPWMTAAGISADQQAAMPKSSYGVALVAQFLIAFMMAGIIGHLGRFGLVGGVISAFFCWVGFCLAPMAVNHRFQLKGWDLTLIDAGYWLVVFVLQGAIIGWMGV